MFRKNVFSFCFGAAVYPIIELAWRRRTHWVMSIAGGTCFLGICSANRLKAPRSMRCFASTGIITAIEFVFGKCFNADKKIWDYSNLPLNYCGQVCLPYSLLWFLLSYPATHIADGIDRYVLPA